MFLPGLVVKLSALIRVKSYLANLTLWTTAEQLHKNVHCSIRKILLCIFLANTWYKNIFRRMTVRLAVIILFLCSLYLQHTGIIYVSAFCKNKPQILRYLLSLSACLCLFFHLSVIITISQTFCYLVLTSLW